METLLGTIGFDNADNCDVEDKRTVFLDDSSGVKVIDIGLECFFFLASSIFRIVSSYKLSVACR